MTKLRDDFWIPLRPLPDSSRQTIYYIDAKNLGGDSALFLDKVMKLFGAAKLTSLIEQNIYNLKKRR